MFSFIKRHWIAYLIGAVVALALGLGLSYFVGVAGSTPEAQRVERNEAERAQDASNDQTFIDEATDDEENEAEDDATAEDGDTAEDTEDGDDA